MDPYLSLPGADFGVSHGTQLGFVLSHEEERRLSECAHAIVAAIQATAGFSHYTLGDVGPEMAISFCGWTTRKADTVDRC